MKNWSDPNQKPVVKSVLFQEVGASLRTSSPFFEGRTAASYTEIDPFAPVAERDEFADNGVAISTSYVTDDGDAFGGYDDSSSFDPIVPAEVLAPPLPPMEPEEDPRVIEALAALEDGLRGLMAARRDALLASEHDVIRLAVALAERIVGAEMAQRPELLLAAARQGIAVLSESDRYVVRIACGPTDEHLEAFRSEIVSKFPRSELVVDDRLAPFTCIVESEHGRVDESIGERMAAVLEQAGLMKVMESA